jgi:hypothetical protein
MRYISVMVALAAIGMLQTAVNHPAPIESNERATGPKAPFPPIPNKSLPIGSGVLTGREIRDPDLARLVNPRPDLLPSRDSKEFLAGVTRGRAEADEEIHSNRATRWNSGMFISIDMIDRETGLYHSGFGCVVDDEILGRVEGHNARIAEYIRDHGLPKNSFKPWEKELFGLKEYFEGRSRTDKPIRMTVDGPPARSPDGQFVVRLVERPFKYPGKRPTDDWLTKISPCLVVNDLDDEANRIYFPREDAELYWGPKGSWFAVLRSRSRRGNGMDYFAIDLRGMRCIREESGAPPLGPRS